MSFPSARTQNGFPRSAGSVRSSARRFLFINNSNNPNGGQSLDPVKQSGTRYLNAVAYVNKDVEKLFTEGGATYDVAVRKEKYQAVQKILADDAPYIFLYYQKAWSGQNKRIQGIVPSALGIGWNQPDWYAGE